MTEKRKAGWRPEISRALQQKIKRLASEQSRSPNAQLALLIQAGLKHWRAFPGETL